jgi:hypothetical protein
MFPLGRLAGITIALALLAAVAALVSIWRSAAHSRKVRLIWTALVVLIPFVGPCAWLLLGRVRRRSR